MKQDEHQFGFILQSLFGMCLLSWSLSGTVLGTPNQLKWNHVLSVLNEVPSPEPSFYSHPVEEDLLSLYAKELAQIKGQLPVAPQGESKKEKRERENRFIFEKISELNEKTFRSLQALTKGTKDYSKVAAQVLTQVKRHSVASLESTMKDPRGGEIGFCFGRALLIHYLLLHSGVSQKDIAKVFNVGQLLVGGQMWQFHVAVLLSDPQAGFLVVDPLQETPMPYSEWAEKNRLYEVKGRLSRSRFYVTAPRKFLASYGKYDLTQLEDPLLKSYFAKLLLTLPE